MKLEIFEDVKKEDIKIYLRLKKIVGHVAVCITDDQGKVIAPVFSITDSGKIRRYPIQLGTFPSNIWEFFDIDCDGLVNLDTDYEDIEIRNKFWNKSIV